MNDPHATPQRPNILFITTDQQRFDTICSLGNPHIYTPHLNWLCDNGIVYDRCYADCPMCIPSRATIMIGKTGYNTGLLSNYNHIRPLADYPTLPALLTAAGYQTRAQGKMHFEPMRKNYGFESMELPEAYYRECARNEWMGLPKEHGVGENELEPVISTVHENRSLTHWTVRRSIDFLETRDDSRPFFLWTSFTKPHPPLDPCLNYWTLYQNNDVPAPFSADWSAQQNMEYDGFRGGSYSMGNLYRLSPRNIENVRRAYYACITQIDYSLGLLFARMRELGLLRNTWIIFTSDHGEMLGDHGMNGKGMFFEGSAHIPLLVCPPPESTAKPHNPGQHVNSLTTLADVMPTILAIAGVDAPADQDGLNLLGLLEKPVEREFYGNLHNVLMAIIQGEWKYLWCTSGGHELLFNTKDDPQETHNLAHDPKQAKRLQQMHDALVRRVKEKSPELTDGDRMRSTPLIPAAERGRWPGFHSALYPCDVLH